MLFNSWEFLILLSVTVLLYYLPIGGNRRRIWQIGLLMMASAVFYAWNEPRLLFLLLGSCLLNAIAVERILFHKSREQGDAGNSQGKQGAGRRETRDASKSRGSFGRGDAGRGLERGAATSSCDSTETPKRRNTETPGSRARLWLFWTVALNLGFLAFFKYAGFLAGLLPASSVTESLKHWFAGIPLPVGISFYTFQGISLVVDVWRSDISERTAARLSARGRHRISSVRDTSFYIAFFPQLVAGPIVKAHEFIDQIGSKMIRDIDWKTVRRGLVLGYFFKVFVADNLAEQTGTLTLGAENLANNGPLNLLPLLYGYSLKIFADFAGYSLIAIGLGALFGYRIPSNFNFPYLATSITDFWRRWHISLSSWLRDYLYIPLGGNRKGAGRTYFNLFLVMFLGGLWHGAAWKFAIWGSLHGIFLALERLMGARKSERETAKSMETRAWRREPEAGGQEHGEASQQETAKSMETRAWRREPEAGSQEHGAGLGSHDGSGGSSHARVSSLASLSLPLKAILKWLFTFHLVTFLWLTFMMPDMASIRGFFEGLLSGRSILQGPPVFSLVFYGSAVVMYHAWGWFRQRFEHFAAGLMRSPVEPVLHGIMLFLVVSNPGAPRGFIYFQF